MRSIFPIALHVVLAGSALAEPVSPPAHSKILEKQLGGMTPEEAGHGPVAMERFMENRTPIISRHIGHWRRLAEKLLPRPGQQPRRAEVTRGEVAALFRDMRRAQLGSRVPDDGCVARADVAAMAAERRGIKAYKVYNSGRLHADTPRAIGGKVWWGFHVAPAVKVAGRLMVIDPALFERPATVEEWRAAMHDPRSKIQVTGADELRYREPETREDRLRRFARNLAFVEGVRRWYEPLREKALARDRARSKEQWAGW